MKFMQRALELAELGLGSVSHNPMVGCVIVHDGKIIGEGYYQKFGGPHAEVNAINAVFDQSLLSESTAYVTLEPCSIFAKTPPCADLLIEKKVKKIVIACLDPNSSINGKGVTKLKQAGIEVEVGLLQEEAADLNKRFFTFHKRKRPYVILKWAQTADAFVARENFDSKWISNQYSRQLVHKWRTEEDAILIGKNTAIYDNPLLTAREWKGKNPTRVLLDSQLQINSSCNLFNDEAKTLILNEVEQKEDGSNTWIKLEKVEPEGILQSLYKEDIQSVIVEGGAAVLNSFIASNCWDEARVFVGGSTFEKGIEAPKVTGALIHQENILGDDLKIYRNQHGRRFIYP